MMDYIAYGRQNITEDDIQAVVNALRSDYLTQGPLIEQFEQCLCNYVGSTYAVVVANATAALHLSCLALGVGPGDVVWTTPNTFVATANCALYCGADIDFVDINSKTYNMDVVLLEEKLMTASKQGRLPKVVIPVHFSGQPCPMKKIFELSKKYGFFIIEDASHAIGAEYETAKIGDCRYSDIVVFSFHPVKIITSGEGGAVITNNPKLAETVAQLRTHGITRDRNLLENKREGAWHYEQQQLGFNYRITDLQCALGITQLNKIEHFLERRRFLVNLYYQKLENFPIIRPYVDANCHSSWHLYVIQLLTVDRKHIFEKMREANIGVNVHYIPVHLQPYYKKRGFKVGDFPIAEQYYARALTLPLHPLLDVTEIEYVCEQLKNSLLHVEMMGVCHS